jgi:hypothetical protein
MGLGIMDKLGNFWLEYFEPKAEYLCKEARQQLKECIANSKCYQETGNFKKCVQDDIENECIPFRKQYSRCKRSSIDRSRDFRTEDRFK